MTHIMLTFSKSLYRYLHEVCLPSVVHRNFKSANILLDEEHNAHLSDCGLAALTPNTERQASITNTSKYRDSSQMAPVGVTCTNYLVCPSRFLLKWLAHLDTVPQSFPCQEFIL